jgi:transcriptional regulator with XRE-family HTH domain
MSHRTVFIDPTIPSTDRRAFRESLVLHMAKLNMSAAELARQAHISKDAVSSYTSMRSLPTPVTLSKLAGALKCTPRALLGSASGHENADARLAVLESDRPGCKRLVASVTVPADVAAEIFARLVPYSGPKKPN